MLKRRQAESEAVVVPMVDLGRYEDSGVVILEVLDDGVVVEAGSDFCCVFSSWV